jgi:hypothetical protein
MERRVAGVPESIPELCLVRFGLIARRWSAVPHVRGLARALDRAADEAIRADAGLLRSERFALGLRHLGALQYWRSFEALDAWSHRPPHSDWWRRAVDRMRRRGDLGVYHEAYLVPRQGIESIYLDCPPIGLASFGDLGESVGPLTTAKQRLGRLSGPCRSG